MGSDNPLKNDDDEFGLKWFVFALAHPYVSTTMGLFAGKLTILGVGVALVRTVVEIVLGFRLHLAVLLGSSVVAFFVVALLLGLVGKRIKSKVALQLVLIALALGGIVGWVFDLSGLGTAWNDWNSQVYPFDPSDSLLVQTVSAIVSIWSLPLTILDLLGRSASAQSASECLALFAGGVVAFVCSALGFVTVSGERQLHKDNLEWHAAVVVWSITTMITGAGVGALAVRVARFVLGA